MNLVGFDGDLVDKQPDVGLTQRGVVAAQAFSQQLRESANHVRRDPSLAGYELTFERRDIDRQISNPLTMVHQTLGEVSIGW